MPRIGVFHLMCSVSLHDVGKPVAEVVPSPCGPRNWFQLSAAFNEVAIHVYRKLGFIEEGRLVQSLYRDGVYHDQIGMYMLEKPPKPVVPFTFPTKVVLP